MKKLINVFLCTLCTVAFFSCEKEIQTPASPEEQIVPEGYELLTFTAVNEQIISRTSLSDGHTCWSEGDAIKVICSDGTAANAILTDGAGTATGTFAGMVPAGKTPIYAVYPAAAYASRDGSTVNVTVAAEQAGTFAAGNIAVAKIDAESHNMSFKNVNSLLVFQLKAGSEVTKVEVTSVDGTALAGTVPVDCSGENPVPGTPASTASTVSMTTNGAGTYYLSIVEPEANHAKGLTMTYYTGSGPYTKTGEYYLNKDLPIVANNMYQFGEVETDGNYYVTVAGAGNHSGMDWANAFSKEEMWKRLTLTAAQQLDPAEDGADPESKEAKIAAIDGATFHMAAGTYDFGDDPKIAFNETNPVTVTLKGGYNASTGARDLANYATIITGNRDDGANPVTGHICLKLRYNMNITLDGLHFENGLSSSDKGGALNCYGEDLNVTLVDCVISNNKNIVDGDDKNGAGLYLESVGSCSATRVTFSNNTSLHAPALYVYSSDITLNNCTFSGNTASNWGGTVRIRQGNPICVFNNCTIDGNSATNDSGGVYVDAGTTTFTNCSFTGNHCGGVGGALTVNNGTVNISGGSFKGNYAGTEGGAIRLTSGTPELNIENCTFGGTLAGEPNYAIKDGGAISLKKGTTTITNCSLIGNHACYDSADRKEEDVAFDDVTDVGYGGAIDCFDTAILTINGGTISGNVAWRGGAMNISSSSAVNLNGVTFTANGTQAATRAGGAIFCRRNPVITNCTFGGADAADGNKAKFGGAINHVKHDGNNGLMTVNGGTFRNNVATENGGAICEESGAVINRYSGQGTLFQDNWVSNDVADTQGGGAIWAETYSGSDNKRVDVNYAVFKGNEAFSGGACFVYGNNSKICLNYCTFGGENSGDANYARGNSGNGGGGTLCMGSQNTYADLVECTITGDHAKRYGGSIFANTNKDFVARGCTFTGCYSSSGWGGAIATKKGAMGQTQIQGGSFINCYSNCGGAILSRMSAGKLIFTAYNGEGTLFQGNHAHKEGEIYQGGVIQLEGAATVTDGVSSLRVTIWKTRFVGNYAGQGGVMYAKSAGKPDIYIDRCSFDGNYVTRRWGPVIATDGLNRFQMNNCTIRNSYTTSSDAEEQTGLKPSWIALDGMPDDGLVTISNTTIIGDVQYSSDGSSFTPLPSGNALIAIWGNQPNYLINNIIVPNTASVDAVKGTGSEDVKLRYNQLSNVSNVTQNDLGGNVTGLTASSIGGLSWTNNCWQWNGTIGGNAPAMTTASDVLDRLTALNAAYVSWIDSPDDHYDYYGTNRGDGSWWPGAYQPAN